MAGIGDYIKSRQADGASDREILKEVLEQFPGARTTMNSVRWYRSQGNRDRGRTPGTARTAPSARPRPADLPGSIPESLYVDGVELRHGQRGFYYVDQVTTLKGPKMRGFNATIYAGGAKVGEAINRGDGTDTVFHWLDDGDGETSPLERHWLDHVAKLPRIMHRDHPGETIPPTPDMHVSSLVDDFLVARRLRRAMADSVVFLVGGKLMHAKLEGTTEARLRRSIELKHPLARILNGMPMADAIRLVPGAW